MLILFSFSHRQCTGSGAIIICYMVQILSLAWQNSKIELFNLFKQNFQLKISPVQKVPNYTKAYQQLLVQKLKTIYF